MSKASKRTVAEAKLRLWDLLARKKPDEITPDENTILAILSADLEVRRIWLERHPGVAEAAAYPNVERREPVPATAPPAIVP